MKKSTVRKFALSMGITFAAMLVVMLIGGGVYAGIQALTRPPVIPAYVEVRTPVRVPVRAGSGAGERNGEYIYTYEYEVIFMERKPYFYTFLLFGIDDGNNTDVIMVAALDTVTREAYIVSIPRDTRIETQRRLRKPVSAYAVGRGGGRGHDGGVEELISDVRSLFGFVPDFYVRIDYEAFERAVDSVGGVRINVPFHKRYDDPVGGLHINIPAGIQTLNGRQALHFARFRNANYGHRALTDFERIENQQAIVRALFNELMSPATLLRLPELIGIYRDHVHTNLTYQEKLFFATQLNQMRGATISTHTIPIERTERAGWYEMPCEEGILELVNSTISPFVADITPAMVNIAQ